MALDENTTYLGDGAYCKVCEEGEFVKVFTSNGIETTNAVYLDMYALRALKRIIEALEDDRK